MMEQSKASLLNRARAKFLSQNLSMRLIESNPDSYLKRSYERSTYCNSVLAQTGQTLTGSYCKNRWCAICNRIRTAVLIDGYEPAIRQLDTTYFVTLTKQTVQASYLPKSIDFMNKAWRQILTSRDGRRRKIKGVRKAECTIRPNDRYHYHFHVVVESLSAAEWLVSEWLKIMGSFADPKAQDIRLADEKSLKELFKYFTKLTVKGENKLIDYKRMDVIFNALRGKRVYQPFGGVRPISEDIEEVQSVTYEYLEQCEQNWNWNVNDWINDAGECLTGYKPNEQFKALFHPKILAETEVGSAEEQPTRDKPIHVQPY